MQQLKINIRIYTPKNRLFLFRVSFRSPCTCLWFTAPINHPFPILIVRFDLSEDVHLRSMLVFLSWNFEILIVAIPFLYQDVDVAHQNFASWFLLSMVCEWNLVICFFIVHDVQNAVWFNMRLPKLVLFCDSFAITFLK